MAIKLTLKAARVNRGLTQTEASKLIGIAKTTLHNWENGKSVPSIKQISSIEQVYNLSYDDLIFLPTDYTFSVTENRKEN